MANALYDFFRNSQLGLGSPSSYPIDFATPGGNGFKLTLTDNTGADGAPSITTHDYYDDIDGSTVTNGLSSALTSLTVGSPQAVGTFDAADMTPGFTSVTGAEVDSITLLLDTATASTSPLIGYWDTGVTGLPLTPNGGDVNVSFNALGIFKF